MKAYLLYSTFLVGICYPIVAHAAWSPQVRFISFADEMHHNHCKTSHAQHTPLSSFVGLFECRCRRSSLWLGRH